MRADRFGLCARWVRARAARQRRCLSAGDGGDLVGVELEQVVGCRDEPPFRPAGGSSAALEASDLAVELQLPEYRLDRGLAPAGERGAVRSREDSDGRGAPGAP